MDGLGTVRVSLYYKVEARPEGGEGRKGRRGKKSPREGVER